MILTKQHFIFNTNVINVTNFAKKMFYCFYMLYLECLY